MRLGFGGYEAAGASKLDGIVSPDQADYILATTYANPLGSTPAPIEGSDISGITENVYDVEEAGTIQDSPDAGVASYLFSGETAIPGADYYARVRFQVSQLPWESGSTVTSFHIAGFGANVNTPEAVSSVRLYPDGKLGMIDHNGVVVKTCSLVRPGVPCVVELRRRYTPNEPADPEDPRGRIDCDLRVYGRPVEVSVFREDRTEFDGLRAGTLHLPRIGIRFQFSASNPNFGAHILVDDWAVNDSQGEVNNSWCGPKGRVALMRPVEQVQRSDGWTGAAGGTGDLIEAVNNVPLRGTNTPPPTYMGNPMMGAANDETQIRNDRATTTDTYTVECESYADVIPANAERITAVYPVTAVAREFMEGFNFIGWEAGHDEPPGLHDAEFMFLDDGEFPNAAIEFGLAIDPDDSGFGAEMLGKIDSEDDTDVGGVNLSLDANATGSVAGEDIIPESVRGWRDFGGGFSPWWWFNVWIERNQPALSYMVRPAIADLDGVSFSAKPQVRLRKIHPDTGLPPNNPGTLANEGRDTTINYNALHCCFLGAMVEYETPYEIPPDTWGCPQGMIAAQDAPPGVRLKQSAGQHGIRRADLVKRLGS